MRRLPRIHDSAPFHVAGVLLLLLMLTVSVEAGKPAGKSSRSPGNTLPVLPPLNEKVLTYAREQVGQRVGDGSCATLAIAALKASGAKAYPDSRAEGGLVWGEPVASFQEALPGDILQFENAVFHGRQNLAGGRWISWHHEYPHHTAIVSRVAQRGKVFAILQQNVTITWKGQEPDEAAKGVQETTLRLDSLRKGGSLKLYRPVPATRPRAAGFAADDSDSDSGSDSEEGGESAKPDRDSGRNRNQAPP